MEMQAAVIEETGVLKVKVDSRLWHELDELSRGFKADLGTELVTRIHLKDKELNKWWMETSTLRKRLRPFRTKRIPINKSRENGKKIEALHKSVLANVPPPKLILEYNLIIKDLIDDIKALNDDGGEE